MRPRKTLFSLRVIAVLTAFFVMFAAAEPMLSVRAYAYTEKEMEELLGRDGDIGQGSDWRDIIGVDIADEYLQKIGDILSEMVDILSSPGEFLDTALDSAIGFLYDLPVYLKDALDSLPRYVKEAIIEVGNIFQSFDAATIIKAFIDLFGDKKGEVDLGNPPLMATLKVIGLGRLLDQPDALGVELPVLFANFLIAEVIWLFSKHAGGPIGKAIGYWWGECLLYIGIWAEDLIINGIKREELELFGKWYGEIKVNYKRDHEALEKITYSMEGKLQGLYAGLANAGAASFSSNPVSVFGGGNWTYRNTDPAQLYIDDYKERSGKTLAYAEGFAAGASGETDDIAAFLKDAVSKMGQSALDSKGYREVLQARNRINLFSAQEAVNMRLDVTRQTDLMARQALDRQQRRTDRQAALERSLGSWKNTLSPAAVY
ncbi:MAG: hypothetical protein FWG71_02495 [Synergistaceae bacterium]|nr:hypothetical protein [Synergistaceae bacterium]